MNESTTDKVHVARMKFQVTDENIKNACKADGRYCMIAEAIRAELPYVRNISVDMMSIRWSDPRKGWRYIYLTPKRAQFALVDFDMGLKIKPFSFETRSGHATPMIRGTGKNRKRAHKVRENKILKVTDKGTLLHTVGRDSVPMTPETKATKERANYYSQPGKGRPREWHPSHNSLRHFGMRGFTEGYEKKDKF